jgi:hypothetical protein
MGVTILPIDVAPEMMFGNRDLKNVELVFRVFLIVKASSVFGL